jgi:hypothetical protein
MLNRHLGIRMTKRTDGGAVLHCTRSDGSVTWQRQEGKQAMFFPLHDLTHFAVESVLGFQQGFFGLIADGWDIGDTDGKGPRGALPREAVIVEHMVGMFDVERASGGAWSAEEFATQLATKGLIVAAAIPAWLTDAGLDGVRIERQRLFSEWYALPAASDLHLTF